MKRFWLVLLSLGLVMAFSASAFAVDVKFSGEFYVASEYLDKLNVRDDGTKSVSTAFFFQRLRLKSEFVVSPGLSLITRATIMDRAWGADRSTPGTANAYLWSGFPGGADSAGTLAENQNIAFDWAYLAYTSPIGIWNVGYMLDGPWGTKFGDSEYANPRIIWILPVGNWMFLAAAVKLQDHSYIASSGNTNAGTYTDADSDKYAVGGLYQWKGGQAGLLLGYWRYAFVRPVTNATAYLYGALPYLSAQFGPVKVEAELWYITGDLYKTDSGTGSVKLENNIMAYVDATVDLGMVYFGGMAVYVSGNDPANTDRITGGVFNTGENLRPTLLLFNDTRYRETGSLAGYNATATSYGMTNGYMFQGRAGVRPMDKLDIMASLTYAIVDKKGGAYGQAAGTWVGDTYGTEIDVTATYKITNNLSYMLGGAYLFTGSYFKGTNDNNSIVNDYLIINKLTLTF